nr:ORF2 [Torque teno felis virus]
MQKPFPGPNVMLPALSLSDPPDLDHHLAYKKREAIWKKLISDEHKKWCLCGSYLNHFLPATEALRSKSCSEENSEEAGTSGGGEGAEGGMDTDALEDLIVAGGGEDGYLIEDLFINGFPDDIDIYLLEGGNL